MRFDYIFTKKESLTNADFDFIALAYNLRKLMNLG